MNKNLLYFKLYKIFFLTMMVDPIFVIYAYSSGLSANQIYILTSIQTILIVLLEVPTGVITDLFGCKYSIILGIISYVSSNIIILLCPFFIGFIGSTIFISLYKVLISGADETYLYLALDNKDDYTKAAGTLDSINFILTGLISISVGYLYAFDEKYPFALSIIICAISFAMVTRLENIKEYNKSIKTLKELNYEFYSNVKNGFKIVFENGKLRWFILCSAAINFALVALMETYQLYFNEQNIPVQCFGWIYFILYMVSSLSSKVSFYFKRFDSYKIFMILFGVLVLTPLLMAMPYRFLIFVIIFPRIVIGIYPAMIKEYINKEIAEDRATIFSIRSLLSKIPQVFLLPCVGYLIDNEGTNFSLILIAIILLGLMIILLISLFKLGVIKKAK